MTGVFPSIDVSEWPKAEEEPLGTKEKEWVRDPRRGADEHWPFKYRENETTGDDRAERIAAAIAESLAIPHATVELASRRGRRGVIVRDFTAQVPGADLRLGNNLLVEFDPGYAADRRSRVAKYSLDKVFATVERPFINPPAGWDLPIGVVTAADVFAGYLLLDALIANQDRNHQNWGVIYHRGASGSMPAELTPSFDHASSLGRSMSDQERDGRLATKDRGFAIEAFAVRARTKFIEASGSSRRMTTSGAFAWAARRRPGAGRAWLDRLDAFDPARFGAIVSSVPEHLMSLAARRFAVRMMELNRVTLLSVTT